MNKILVIGLVWPEPTSSAAGQRIVTLMDFFLKNSDEVHFVTAAQTTKRQCDLNKLGIHTQQIAINDSNFDNVIIKLQPDIVIFDRFMVEEQFSWRVKLNCPNALRILDTEDLHCLRDARREAHRLKRLFIEQDLNTQLAQREIAAILRSDLTLMISTVEIGVLHRVFKIDLSLLYYIPIVVLPNQIKHTSPPFNQRKHFITIGNFKHKPNWDSVLWLRSEIWPLIHDQLPDIQLHIYGAYPNQHALSLTDNRRGFIVKGETDNIVDVMESSRVCLVPLRFGAGLKGKLIDAMLHGTPNVTTHIGAEGMTNSHIPWPGIISQQSANAFANAAVRLYKSNTLWQESQDNGFKLLNSNFLRNQFESKLINKILHIKADLASHRSTNFYGNLLWKQQFRSTEFMSRWIEEKNKTAKTNN